MKTTYPKLQESLHKAISKENFEKAEICELDLADFAKKEKRYLDAIYHWLMTDFYRILDWKKSNLKLAKMGVPEEEIRREFLWGSNLNSNNNLRTIIEKSNMPQVDFENFHKSLSYSTIASEIDGFIRKYSNYSNK